MRLIKTISVADEWKDLYKEVVDYLENEEMGLSNFTMNAWRVYLQVLKQKNE